jgi:fatty acid desaturase
MNRKVVSTDFDLREAAPGLTHISRWQTFLALAGDWLAIAGAIACWTLYPNIFTFLLVQVVVAARQHALFVMMHEGAHGYLCKGRKWNDRISNWFAAWPTFMSTNRFRHRHWEHHRHTNTEQDPDWQRKLGNPQWKFPKTGTSLARDFLPYLWGQGVLEIGFAQTVLGINWKELKAAWPYYGAIAVVLTVTGNWPTFLVCWMLPYLTLLPILHKVRMIVEHFGLPNSHALNTTRNVVAPKFVLFLIGPHATALHLVHHLCPYAPWHQVPKLHALLQKKPEYRQLAHENDGYLFFGKKNVLQDLVAARGAKIDRPSQAA